LRIFLNKPEKGEEDLKPVNQETYIFTKNNGLYTQMEHSLEGNTSRARARARNLSSWKIKQKTCPENPWTLPN